MEELTPEHVKDLQQQRETELKEKVPTVTSENTDTYWENEGKWAEDKEFWHSGKVGGLEQTGTRPKERREKKLDAEAKEFTPPGGVHQVYIAELEPVKVMRVEITFPGGQKTKTAGASKENSGCRENGQLLPEPSRRTRSYSAHEGF